MTAQDASAGRPDSPRGRGAPGTRTLRALAGAGLIVAVGPACSPEEPRIAEGQALYEANCQSCHGEGLRGDGPLASQLPVQPPSILEHLGHHTRAQLVRLITGGIPPAMPPAPVTPEQVQLIVDYAWTRVPESEVAALRAMQQQMEEMEMMMGDTAASPMPEMDHSAMPGN